MKAALSLTLVVTLMTSALPVTAQEGIDRTAGPIRRAIPLEAARLAVELAVADAGRQAGASTNADWSRVRMLDSGTEIVVTASGSQPGTRYVLSVDESGITVLNLAAPTLPDAARDVLRDRASRHPTHFSDAETGETFLLDRHVRLGSEGVFVADRKVADLRQIVERMARTDVVEIRRKPAPRHPAARGALIGAAAGIATGVAYVAHFASSGCHWPCGGAYTLAASVVFGGIGAGAGAGVGALVGRSNRATDGVVYRRV